MESLESTSMIPIHPEGNVHVHMTICSLVQYAKPPMFVQIFCQYIKLNCSTVVQDNFPPGENEVYPNPDPEIDFDMFNWIAKN